MFLREVFKLKKTLSIFLATVILLLGVCAPIASAQQISKLPAIILGGFSSGQLYIDYGKESEEKVWGFEASAALEQTASDLENFIPALLRLMFLGDFATIGKVLGNGGKIILEKLFCNEDSSSVYPLETYPADPAISTYTYLKENGLDEHIKETALSDYVAEKIGGDNVFFFQYDMRMGMVDMAALLKDYIDAVLEYTGSDRLNIFGISYGGFLLGSYLSLYGTEGKINNAVLNVPALGGTSFAKRFFTADTEFPVYSLISFAELAIGMETNLAPLFRNTEFNRIEVLAKAFLNEIMDLPYFWGSLWDLLTPEDYEELKPLLLDSEASAELIRKSDIVHHEIMPNYRKNFLACMEKGVNISIMCNYSSQNAFGGEKYGDMLLDANAVSGAKVVNYGDRFEDGYPACGTVCGKAAHNHISPSMEVDASCAYLPENTWFVKDQFHGMYAGDENTFELVKTLLLAEEKADIYTYEEFPQFLISENRYYDVTAGFDSDVHGYVDGGETEFTVTNISTKPMVLTAVECEGIDLDFNLPANRAIKAGESITFTFDGEIPEAQRKHFGVKISYLMPTLGIPAASRTIDFSVI